MDIHHPSLSEREPALDLVADAFGNPRARRPAVRAAVLTDPDYSAETTLLATDDDGEVVGHLATKRSAIALDGEWLSVARLGSVCSAPNRRRRGIGAALVEAAAALYPDVAAIILNPAAEEYVRVFYETLGFRAARRTIGCWQVLAAAVPLGEPLLVRAARAGEAAVLDRLYVDHYGQRNGSKQRTAAWWDRRIAGEPLLWAEMTPRTLVAERDGQAVAYAVVTDDDDHRVWELAGAPDGATALLSHEAVRHGDRFTVAIDPHDPLWPLVAVCAPADLSPEPGIVMVRAQDQGRLADTLGRVLAGRSASLGGDHRTATVTAEGRTLACDWTELLCLVYDGSVLAERMEAGAVQAESNHQALWQAIFRARPATRRMTDAF
ncbi:MAG: GNAT family N-acetyltransferase [Armatimonadetes bacterium]|nr:GNAT family N-acetyltransferase [Armatimonadota bacterium]